MCIHWTSALSLFPALIALSAAFPKYKIPSTKLLIVAQQHHLHEITQKLYLSKRRPRIIRDSLGIFC